MYNNRVNCTLGARHHQFDQALPIDYGLQMGLFSSKQDPDPELVELLIRQSDNGKKYGQKMIAKHGAGLRSNLRRGEDILAVCPTDFKLAAITNQRTLVVKGMNVTEELEHSDVRDTKIFSAPNRVTVKVFSHSYYLDYRPDDVNRHLAMIPIDFETPREANEACAIIDRIVGS